MHDDFKASWQWFSRFRERLGIQQLLLHGKGAEVDRESPDLVAALNKLYVTIAKYVPENINIYISKIFWISTSWMRI